MQSHLRLDQTIGTIYVILSKITIRSEIGMGQFPMNDNCGACLCLSSGSHN